jgi:phospholipid-translocating ATPase
LLIISSVLIFEFGVDALRARFFTTDEDFFQALEKDGMVKRRFEEAASGELQMGWDRETNKQRDQELRVREVVEDAEMRVQERREGEVKELLRGRVEAGEVEGSLEGAGVGQGDDQDRMLERGYGRVRVD